MMGQAYITDTNYVKVKKRPKCFKTAPIGHSTNAAPPNGNLTNVMGQHQQRIQ
jgi:hypothetical protein